MKITKLEEFITLLEQNESNNLTNNYTQLIQLSGIAKFKEPLFEVIQLIENKNTSDNLSPIKKRLFDVLKKYDPKSLDELRFSALTSYFTPKELSDTIVKNTIEYLKNNGKNKLSILEPSAGDGVFILSLNQYLNSDITPNVIHTVERDSTTYNVLQHNTIPFKNVQNFYQSFESYDSNLKYDLIIGNIPFGTYKADDSKLTKNERAIINSKIHNYFFYKSKEMLNPGGLIVFITSKEIADSVNEKKIREDLVKNLNLVTAIRFPEETFQHANTKVITDLLVFQKPFQEKEEINITQREKDFIQLRELNQETISNFYQKNNNNVLGKLYLGQGFLGKKTLLLSNEKPLNQVFENASEILYADYNKYGLKDLKDFSLDKNNSFEERKNEAINNQLEIKSEFPFIEPGNIVVKNNVFFKVSINSEFQTLYLNPIAVNVKNRERLYSLIELRDKYKNLREAIRSKDFEKAKKEQIDLNTLYDNFVFFYDNILTKENIDVLQLEKEKHILTNLEIVQSNGEKVKSEIFSESILLNKTNEKKATNIAEAIHLTLNEYGYINQNYLSKVYSKPKEECIREALNEKLLYIEPVFSKDLKSIEKFDLVTPERFVSGWVEGKLSVYSKLSQHQSLIGELNQFLNKSTITSSKEELIKNIPVKLTIQEIDPSLGEPWVNNKVFELFGKEYFKDPEFKIYYNSEIDKFNVYSKGSAIGAAQYNLSKQRTYVNYTHIFTYCLMQNAPEFKKYIIKPDGSKIKVSDIEFNTAVQLKMEMLQKEFSKWLFNQSEISKSIEDQYHLLNNAIIREKVNGSYLKFDDIEGHKPYEHQKNCALEKALQNGGLIDHKVGAGKTLTMAMTVMLKKKFNISRKELVVGLPANFVSVYNEFKKAYPEGNFLLVTTEDINTEQKAQEVFYKIANNNYDAVITSHATLMKFPPAPTTDKLILDEIINEIKITLNENDKNSLSAGDYKTLITKLNDAEVLQKAAIEIINNRKSTGSLIFDDLGFGGITVDESHYFKNLEFTTRHTRVAGLGTTKKVQKTRNLLSYVRNIQEKNTGNGKYKGITFATGTTITNSISEMYNLFRYIIPEELQKKSIKSFDQWARVYARKTQEYEESPTGSIKLKERFRYFVKVPELAKMYADMTHYVDDSVFKLPAPDPKFELQIIDTYKEQEEYLENIKKFGSTKDFSYLPYYSGATQKKAVGLICVNLGRKASLSLKLIDRRLPDNPNDKIHRLVDELVKEYHNFNEVKGTQLVFCDQGVPGKAKEFNIYKYIKDKLIERGIPANQIEFIHSWQNKKTLLYEKVNKGEIRIVLGSTQKMGVGVNMQEKITVLHHLDLPWRPADLDQRNGRGARPGNLVLPKYDNILKVKFYATKNTLDSYNFNLLNIKDNFIKQIKNANINVRSIDEGAVDSKGNMNFSEYMAACSPNQFLTEKLKKEKELQKLLDEKASFEMIRRQNKIKFNWVQTEYLRSEKMLEKLSEDKALSKNFNPNILDGKNFEDHKEIADYLRNKFQININSKVPGTISILDKGFELVTRPKYNSEPFSSENVSIYLKSPTENLFGYKSNSFTKNDTEVSLYSFNCLERIGALEKENKENLEKLLNQKLALEDALSLKFEKGIDIDTVKNEIKSLEYKIEEENKKIETNIDPSKFSQETQIENNNIESQKKERGMKM